MKNIKGVLVGLSVIMSTLMMSAPVNAAQVNFFTDHQVIHMVRHGVNSNQDVRFPTGNIPYIGRAGVEYQRNALTYSLAYIHRSNADLMNQDEYNYDGVSLGIKYTHCIALC